jgi:hypothetical protein
MLGFWNGQTSAIQTFRLSHLQILAELRLCVTDMERMELKVSTQTLNKCNGPTVAESLLCPKCAARIV